MSIVLAAGDAEPLYRQVRNAIETAVATGSYRQRPLPSSRELAAELGVSRTTINLAYQELQAEGFIVSQPRVGFWVNAELLARLPALGTRAEPAGNRSVDWEQQLLERSSFGLSEIQKDYHWQRYPYPFIYGQTSTSSFPVAAWLRALRTALDQPHIGFSLRDAGSEDDPLLIEQLCTTILPARGIAASPDQILLTSGAQHGLFLVTRALVRPGDTVALEDPGYPDAAHIAERAGGQVLPVQIDEYGMRVDRIPASARLISVTPSHQFPTNVALGVARRAELVEHASTHGGFIVEDDYDSEFRYVGRPSPALRATGDERVVYLGSFSKFLAPGLRVGFVVAEAPLIENMRRDRRYSIRHLPGHSQRALAIMIAAGDYHRALRRLRSRLRERWRIMGQAVRHYIDPGFEVPHGGTSMWVPLPPGADPTVIATAAAAEGVLVEPGSPFYLGRVPERGHLRLAYSALPASRISPGVQALARIIAGTTDPG